MSGRLDSLARVKLRSHTTAPSQSRQVLCQESVAARRRGRERAGPQLQRAVVGT